MAAEHKTGAGQDGSEYGGSASEFEGGAISARAAARIAELERQLARRTTDLGEARRALDREFLDTAAVPNAAGHSLSAKLHDVVRDLNRVSEQLEERNTALAIANWRLERRVEERTAALQVALEAKRESDARFRRVADGVPQLLWTSYPEGRWNYASLRWQVYTGQAEADTHGLGWLQSVHPEDRDRTMTAWHAAVKSGTRLFVEHRLRGIGGEYRWFETQAMPAQDGVGRGASGDVQWVGSSSDIHARKLAEQVLRDTNASLELELASRQRDLAESKARFHAYFQIAPEPLFMVTAAADGRFLYEAFNGPFERLTGFQESQAKGREAHAFMPAATAVVLETHYRHCLDGEVPCVFDAMLALPTGDRILRITLVPTQGAGATDGATRSLLGSARDLSNAPGHLLAPDLDA